METIFVTRHPGAVEWLKKTHPEGGLAKLFGHVNTEDVRGRRVVGTLPIHLAAIAGEYWHLEMKLPPELRGKGGLDSVEYAIRYEVLPPLSWE